MGKLQERENKRKSIIGSMVDSSTLSETAVEPIEKGRPKEKHELKKRISLSVLPSLYEDIQKIAYVQRKNASEVISELMEQYRSEHEKELEEYDHIK